MLRIHLVGQNLSVKPLQSTHTQIHLSTSLGGSTFLLNQVNIKGGTCLSAVHGVVVLLSVLLRYSYSVCEQAEKLEVLDHDFTVTSMGSSIGQ